MDSTCDMNEDWLQMLAWGFYACYILLVVWIWLVCGQYVNP